MSHIFHKEDYFEGQSDFRQEMVAYIRELSRHVDLEDAKNLPKFLNILADRIQNQEIP